MTTSHVLVVHHKDPGQVRDYQEDDYGDYKIRDGEYRLLVVADGMGGHSHGDVASKMAIEALAQFLEYGTWDEPARALRQGFAIANERVHGQGIDMGTTLTAILFHEATNQYWWANVGDSRAYLLEGSTLHQLSRDHSEIQVRVDAGQLTAEDARLSKGRNVLLKAIGPSERVEADVEGPYELVPGQRLLLCSDGLHGMLSEPELAAITGYELQEVAKNLVAAANAAGGKDNIAALVAALSAGETTVFMGATPAVAARPASPWGRLAGVGRMGRVAAAVGVVGVVGLIAVVTAMAVGGGGDGVADEDDETPSVEGTKDAGAAKTDTATPGPITTSGSPSQAAKPENTTAPSGGGNGGSGASSTPAPTDTPTAATAPSTATSTPTPSTAPMPTLTPTPTPSAATSTTSPTPMSTPSPTPTPVPRILPAASASPPQRSQDLTTITFSWSATLNATYDVQFWEKGTNDRTSRPGLIATSKEETVASDRKYCFSVVVRVGNNSAPPAQACEND